MAAFNPYEAPLARVAPLSGPQDGVDLWRDGALLVARNEAEFPDRCLRCNQPAEGYRFRRTVRWHPPVYYALIVINIILYAIVGSIVSKTSRVEAGVCPAHRARRRNAILVGWATFLAGGSLFVVGLTSGGESWQTVAVIAGMILIVAGAIYGVLRSQIYLPKKITKDKFVWLAKVDPDFLAPLPDWPAGAR